MQLVIINVKLVKTVLVIVQELIVEETEYLLIIVNAQMGNTMMELVKIVKIAYIIVLYVVVLEY